jgi:thymidylate synthase
MSNIEKQYQGILRKLVLYGSEKEDRTGTGTLSYFGEQIRHNMSDGFPLLTTKKMAIKSVMTELKWFLKGDTNIKYLLENNCHIWTGDAIKNYEKHNGEINGGPHITKEEYFEDLILTNDEFAKQWGELGPIYGKQWRNWDTLKFVEGENEFTVGVWKREQIDQIQNLIEELKRNPDSRRLMVSAWNVGEMDNMVLPPCHYGFQVYTRELSKFERSRWWGLPKGEHFLDEVLDKYNIPKRAISLMWNQRSVDTFLGLPFNIASYAMLLEIIAKEVNMIPDELIGNLGDVHLYKNHIQQAKEQIVREPYKLPTIELTNVDILNGEFNYKIKDYQSHPTIKAPLSN